MKIAVIDDTTPTQLELFEIKRVGVRPAGIAEAFREFNSLNPHVYRNLKVLAYQALRAGRKKIGMKFLFERLRWEYAIKTDRPEGEFKLNNNFTSRYARLLIDQEPDLADLFEIRELKAVDGKRRKIVTVGK
jgi:hypothetical protein